MSRRWTFNGEGKCTHIPYSKKAPEYQRPSSSECLCFILLRDKPAHRFVRFAKARSWQVLEYHKLVCVWYDAGAHSKSLSLWLPYPSQEH